MKKKGSKEEINNTLRKRAEARIAETPAEGEFKSGGSQLRLLHELQVQQVELKIQNEELLNVKAQLESALNKYNDFYEFAPVSYFTFDSQGVILEVNLTGTKLIQISRTNLIGRKFDTFINGTALQPYLSMLKKVFGDHVRSACQTELITSKGNLVQIHIQSSAPIEGLKCLAVITDLTEVKTAEEAYHKSDEKFRIISTSTPDHIFMQDTGLRYTLVINPQLGLTEKDMIGKTDFDILNENDATNLTEIKKRVLQTSKPEYMTVPVKDKEGITNYFEGSYVPLKNSQGIVNGLIGYFRNITEQMKVQNELEQTKGYLEQLINYANAPIVVWNPEQEIIVFNKAFEHLTGFTSDEVIGKKPDFLFPEKTLKKSKEKINHTLTGDFWDSIEIPILCKNGETKIILWNSANIYENNNLVSTIAQGNDITSRKMAENALEESRRRLNLALENGNIGIWEFDIRNKVLLFDERMEQMTGLSGKSFNGSLNAFLDRIVDEDVNRVFEAFSRSAGNSDSFEAIFRIKREISEINHLMAKGMVYRDPEKTPRILGVCFDITKMKQDTDQSLIRLTEELARSNRELEQFAYVASHDLQEPLRMISSFTQLLEKKYRDKLDQDGKDYIKFTVDGSRRMYNLINDLLAFSRVTTKGRDFSRIEISKVLTDVVRNLKSLIEKRAVSIKADKMPSIYGDRSQIVQLFQNLISNAIKFSNGTPKILIRYSALDDYHLFKIKDNGIGIDPQYFDRIFQIFQRLHTSEQFEGTGIGLAICRRIVERHQGKMWVKSSPGKGSAFQFTIRRNLDKIQNME
jgi:PAS domain S-box-containing protein